MSEMIERVARAMAEAAGFAWEACTQDQWRRDAAAGIKAMREPTEAMFKAGGIHRDGTYAAAWRDMVDAALARQESTPK